MAMKIKYFIFSFMCHLCPFADERKRESEREREREREREKKSESERKRNGQILRHNSCTLRTFFVQ